MKEFFPKSLGRKCECVLQMVKYGNLGFLL